MFIFLGHKLTIHAVLPFHFPPRNSGLLLRVLLPHPLVFSSVNGSLLRASVLATECPQ